MTQEYEGEARLLVVQDTLRAEGDGNWVKLKGSKRGELVICDWYTQMVLEGRGFQVSAGTISTPAVGTTAITDTAAEMCADAPTGTTMIPVFCNVSLNLNAKTLLESGLKSVAAVSTSGTVFVPLPLLANSAVASVCTARAQEAGQCTVTAEAVTTTRRHWAFANPIGANAAGGEISTFNWEPRCPPIDVGPACCYFQIASDTTGPSYFASLDWIELPTINVS